MELVGITAGNFGFKCTHIFRDSTHFTEQTIAVCSVFIINSILPLKAVYSQLFYGTPYTAEQQTARISKHMKASVMSPRMMLSGTTQFLR